MPQLGETSLAAELTEPLLGDNAKRRKVRGPEVWRAAVVATYVVLSASGPLLLDFVKVKHGGRYHFDPSAVVLFAYASAGLLALAVTAMRGRGRQLYRPDMVLRFGAVAALFALGDMLNFASMQRLDASTFSLVGKSLSIALTVGIGRLVLRRRHAPTQYGLVAATVLATVWFCVAEDHARGRGRGGEGRRGGATGWAGGLFLRFSAVATTSSAAVVQEKLFSEDFPFMVQQCWMACGATLCALLSVRVQGRHFADLLAGWDLDATIVLIFYTLHGLSAGLMVKQLGALAKALCVPLTLGLCYSCAVALGTAAVSAEILTAWLVSVTCVSAFALARADLRSTKLGLPGGGRRR